MSEAAICESAISIVPKGSTDTVGDVYVRVGGTTGCTGAGSASASRIVEPIASGTTAAASRSLEKEADFSLRHGRGEKSGMFVSSRLPYIIFYKFSLLAGSEVPADSDTRTPDMDISISIRTL